MKQLPVAFLLTAFSLLFAKSSTLTQQRSEKPTMNKFAMIFRSTRPISPAEAPHRQAEIDAWVKDVSARDIKIEPRHFGKTVTEFAAKSDGSIAEEGSHDGSFDTIVFAEAPSEKDVVEIAKLHPVLRYGMTVEVRPWSGPRN